MPDSSPGRAWLRETESQALTSPGERLALNPFFPESDELALTALLARPPRPPGPRAWGGRAAAWQGHGSTISPPPRPRVFTPRPSCPPVQPKTGLARPVGIFWDFFKDGQKAEAGPVRKAACPGGGKAKLRLTADIKIALDLRRLRPARHLLTDLRTNERARKW